MTHASNQQEPRRGSRSLVSNSFAGVLADGVTLIAGIVTATVTARWLGPAEKGTLSTLLLIAHGFLFYICALGLGDAVILLVGKGRVRSQEAFSSSLSLLMMTGALGVVVLMLVSVPADWSTIRVAVVLAGAGLYVWLLLELMLSTLNAHERLFITSGIRATVATVGALATVCGVVVADLGILGGVIGPLVGMLAGLLLAARKAKAIGLSFRPGWNVGYLRLALPYGLPIQASMLLLAASQRLDQLVVYTFLGEASGGLYSVALTLGQLVAYLPVAIATAGFPRVTTLSEEAAVALTGRMCRFALASALICALLLAGLMPLAIPVAFGAAYKGAVLPAIVLTAGGVIWSAQWVLARGRAAEGHPRLLVVSLGVNLVTMLSFAAVLIPSFGLIGGTISSVTGAIAGLGVCVAAYRQRLSVKDLVPRPSDFVYLVRHAPLLLSRRSAAFIATTIRDRRDK